MFKKYSSILLLVLIILGIYFSYLLFKEVEKQTLSNQYQQQEIYARQAEISIINFFDHFKHSLKFISQKEEFNNLNEQSGEMLIDYYESHLEEISAITRISVNGKIEFTYPYVKNVIGKDVSNQAHNVKIFQTHAPVISDVFMTVQGYNAIVYAYPVFKNNIFDGCISLVIPFEYIANEFLKDITIGETGNAFLLSESGIELYCTNKEHINKSILETSHGYDDLSNMAKKMLNREKGMSEYSFEVDGTNKEIVKKIAVYKPIILENTFWSIAVFISKEEVLKVNRGFIIKFLTLLFLMFLIVILFTLFNARIKKKSDQLILQKEQQYKSELENTVKERTEELNKVNESLNLDIVERKKIELELLHAKGLAEKSEKIKTDFLAQMSHEIRTPINTILSFSSLIKSELAHYVDDELKYGFDGIQSAGRRLIRTIDLILNMSDVQLGTYEYIPKKMDICKDVLESLMVEYRVQINEKKLNFTLNNMTENSIIIADLYTVNQIFANLIHNAVKYTLDGSIEIVCDRNAENKLYISVIDTGVGISKEYLPKLFNEFSQEDTGYTRKFEGNGLGLSLVKKYCAINNAEIAVVSEKGKGSNFTVTFNT